jgi:hypothetical protein
MKGETKWRLLHLEERNTDGIQKAVHYMFR